MFTRCGFSWVSRQGSKAAHIVASLADKGNLPGSWCLVLPGPLRAVLLQDPPNSDP